MKSMVDKSHEIADVLEKQIRNESDWEKKIIEERMISYIHACEDFARKIRESAWQQDERTRYVNGNCEKCGEDLGQMWSYCPNCGRKIELEETGNAPGLSGIT